MSEELERAAETSGQMLARLGIDGKLWADEFCNLTGFKDHGWALSWFCNAIMSGHDQAHASRDAEVAELKARIRELEHKLEMRRSSVRDALERNGLKSGDCQAGIDHIDLITGKIK